MLFAIAVIVAPHASAAVPTLATGTLTRQSSAFLAPPETADGNTFLQLQNAWTMTGTFEGILVSNPAVIIHPDGVVTFDEIATFTGAVAASSGTFVWRSAGTSTTSGLVGHLSILSGTGDLANLRGEGTFELHGPTGTYSIYYLFAPPS